MGRGEGSGAPSSSAGKLPLRRRGSYSRSREFAGGAGWAGAERSDALRCAAWGPAPCPAARMPGRRRRMRRRRRRKKRRAPSRRTL